MEHDLRTIPEQMISYTDVSVFFVVSFFVRV